MQREGELNEQNLSEQGQEAAPTTEDELAALRRELDEWRAKADEAQDKYLRSVAEFSNYRKRQDREREQQTVSIKIEVLRQMLPALDDLERALAHVPAELTGAAWVEGVALIERKLQALLAGFNAHPIEALGKPFDPNYHSALMQSESDEYPAGVVMAELQKGYMLGDQVLRPALVQVSSGPVAKE